MWWIAWFVHHWFSGACHVKEDSDLCPQLSNGITNLVNAHWRVLITNSISSLTLSHDQCLSFANITKQSPIMCHNNPWEFMSLFRLGVLQVSRSFTVHIMHASLACVATRYAIKITRDSRFERGCIFFYPQTTLLLFHHFPCVLNNGRRIRENLLLCNLMVMLRTSISFAINSTPWARCGLRSQMLLKRSIKSWNLCQIRNKTKSYFSCFAGSFFARDNKQNQDFKGFSWRNQKFNLPP